jgi:hypothetical protein
MVLLNRKMIAYGRPSEVITPQRLAAAYGGQALWRGDDYAMVLGDIDCCGEMDHHHD